jgi:hypothetical protein
MTSTYVFTCWPPFPEDRSNRTLARLFGIVSLFNKDAHFRAAAYSASISPSPCTDFEAIPLACCRSAWFWERKINEGENMEERRANIENALGRLPMVNALLMRGLIAARRWNHLTKYCNHTAIAYNSWSINPSIRVSRFSTLRAC